MDYREKVEPYGEEMESREECRKRAEILCELGGKDLEIVRNRSLIQGSNDRPGAEELWARVTRRNITPIIYRDLPYKRVHANLQVPVSCGCELAAWGRKQGWQGGCSFCDIGRFTSCYHLSPFEMLNLIGLILRKSPLANRFWRRERKCLVISFSAAGEPLLRYEAVKETVTRLDEIFAKRGVQVFFSLCTSGIASGIQQMLNDVRFCDEYRVQLRFSMHFPTDEERRHFIPARDPVQEIVDLGTAYAEAVRVKFVIHYALIQGVNDSDSHAEKLIRLLHSQRRHILVRISRINPECGASKISLLPPSKNRRKKFIQLLKEGGLECSPVWEGYARWACNAAHFR
ncbi:MAG: hypothetical protein WC445_01635 [Patescibacteria group bacterium]